MLRRRGGHQIRSIWRCHFLQDAFAAQRLEVKPGVEYRVDLIHASGRLGEDTLPNFFGAAAPDLDLDPILRFEGVYDGRVVVYRHRRIEREFALALCPLAQMPCTVAAHVPSNGLDRGGLRKDGG